MAEKSLFWDNFGTDVRSYTAEDFADIFEQLIGTSSDYSRIGTGVGRYNSVGENGLTVSANGTNMTITLTSGFAFISGKMYANTSNLVLTHEQAHPTLLRYDRVILRYDSSDSERRIYATIKKGVAGSTPSPPSMQNDSVIKEICLATVGIVQNRTYINQSNVTDTRADTSICGYLPLHNIYRGMSVSKEGIVTMPNQSFVEAARTYEVGVVPLPKHPTYRTLDIHPTIVDNQGEVTSDNRFTAKASGTYVVTAYFRFDDFLFSGSQYIDFQSFVRTNGVSGAESKVITIRATNVPQDSTFNGTAVIQLNAGDTVMIEMTYFGPISYEPSMINHRVTIAKIN